jgi:hypothetical protein
VQHLIFRRETLLGLLCWSRRSASRAKDHATLDTKQRESATKPWDATPRHQVGVLQQIAQLLATTDVSPQELQNIMEQLKSMVPPIAAATPPADNGLETLRYPSSRMRGGGNGGKFGAGIEVVEGG